MLKKDDIDVEHLPGGDALLHAVRGQALRAAAARRRLRPLLQQGRSSRRPGITQPPKTISELTAYAKKLTRARSDGSLKVVGFDPVFGFYQNAPIAGSSRSRRASGSTPTGKSACSRRTPPGRSCCTWQKELVDFYGYDKLVQWQAGAGDEFSASHAFETRQARDEARRRVARRVHHSRASRAGLRHGADAGRRRQPELYGSGYINGTIIGIPKRGKNHDEAWELVKYLTTNDHALASSRTASATCRRRRARRSRRS